MFNPGSPEPKVQVYIPSYLPLKTEVCDKCKVIAEPKEIIRIIEGRLNSIFSKILLKQINDLNQLFLSRLIITIRIEIILPQVSLESV